MDITKIIVKRTIALIILRISGTLAAGSIGGMELWQSALVAAFIGVMDVAESLSRSYVVDGDLTIDEINTAFASSAEAELAATKKAEPVVVVAEPVVSAPVVTELKAGFEIEEVDEDEAPTA